MKRSTTIGLAAGGAVLTLTAISTLFNKDDDLSQLPEMQACMVSGTMSRSECVAAFKEAQTQVKELQLASPTENSGNDVSQGAPQVAAPVAPPASSGGATSSGSSNNGFWTGYFIRSMMDSSSSRGSDYGRSYAPSSDFSRSSNPPSSYRSNPAVARPVPAAPRASAPDVASRGGFGTTARSMGMGASS